MEPRFAVKVTKSYEVFMCGCVRLEDSTWELCYLHKCHSCGERVSDRYLPYGVCQNCYGTTDAPETMQR